MKLITSIFLILFPLISFANSSLPANRHIAVTGSAQVLAEPDMADIYFEVISQKDQLLDAKREVDDRVNLLIKGADKYGIEQGDIFISGLTSHVNNMIDTETGTVSGDKYLALKTVKVTLKDIKKVDGFIDFAQSVQIGNSIKIHSLSSKAKQLEVEATQLAIDNAKAEANRLAQAFGAELGNVYSISSNSSRADYGYSEGSVKHIILSSPINSESIRNNQNPFLQGQYLGATISVKASIKVVFDLKLK